jgi:hypothetical protein
MADTFTPSLNLCKPEINQSAQTWGIKLNSDLDLLDAHAAAMKSFQAGNDAHVNSLITAAINTNFPRGSVMLWYGNVNAPPVGWAICNGANGTPNLADRFVLGNAGGRTQGEIGGAFSAGAATDVQGWHGHGGATQGTALDVNTIPPHAHTGYTNYLGDHGHVTAYVAIAGINGAGGGPGSSVAAGTGPSTFGAGAHQHDIQTYNTGGGAAHAHNLNWDGNHAHNITVSIVPPYFALAYIMRL